MLADDFFQLAHNDVTGSPRLHSSAIDLGLAAALLGELILGNRVGISRGEVQVFDDGTNPDDGLAHLVLDRLRAEPPQTARVWLTYLARCAYTEVADRLWRGGHVRVRRHRRFGLGQVRIVYVPTSMNDAAKPWAMLATTLRFHEELSRHDACLAGLTLATGLDRFVLDGQPGSAREYLRYVVDRLPPSIRELVNHTTSAVGDAVLAPRH